MSKDFTWDPGLVSQIILGEDWLRRRKSQLKFEPDTLIVGEVELLLRSTALEMLTVVTKNEVKLPPQTVVSCKGQVITEGEI